MNRNIFLFCIFSLPLFLSPAAAYAASLTAASLRNDLSYYRKVAQRQELNENDRRYILLQIESKYQGSGVDLAPLRAEKENLRKPASAPAAKTPKRPAAVPSTENAKRPAAVTAPSAGRGSVDDVQVVETPTDSRIIVSMQGVKRSNYFLLRNPDTNESPKIVLDLYGALDRLQQELKDQYPDSGFFVRVQAGQFEMQPEPIVRVVGTLRAERPYRIRKEDGKWIIQVDRDRPKSGNTAGAAPQPAMPVQSPVSAPPAVPAAPAPRPEKAKTAEPPKTAAPEKYYIEAGDVLAIAVYPAEELSREAIVQPDGKIAFPLIGPAKARGQTPEQLSSMLAKDLSRFVSNPQVTVSVRQFSRRQVFVMGEVRSTGAYNYKENLRLVEFISSMGGFTDNANRREVKIYRGPPTERQIHTVDVEEIIRSGDFSKDFLLQPGDIIEVSKGRARLAILGDVRSPGYYDYRENMQLLELVSLAGGFSDTAKIAQVRVIRESAGGAPLRVDMSKTLAGETKDTVLQSGDTVYIPKKKIASANWVVNNILPWLSLVSLVIVIGRGI